MESWSRRSTGSAVRADKRVELGTSLGRDARGRDARAVVHAHNINDVSQSRVGTVKLRRSTSTRTRRLGSEDVASRGAWSGGSVRAADRGDVGVVDG